MRASRVRARVRDGPGPRALGGRRERHRVSVVVRGRVLRDARRRVARVLCYLLLGRKSRIRASMSRRCDAPR